MLASHVLLRCIREHGAEVQLKWVNDVLSTDGRKMAGVLTEERCRVSVIGMGVNLNNTSFPPELASQATSVHLETGRQVDICVFLCSVLSRLFPMLDNAHGGGIEKLLARWEEDADIMGRRVKVTGEYDEVSGSIRGINRKTGALRLVVNGELVEVYEGSLSYLD
jgi:BirA family biotin operon repressor/biotin-[acetyl-CoA-carboxylase] ligase